MAPKEKVVNVKVEFIRPKYKNLKEWCDDTNNIYIGRKGIVFITIPQGNSKGEKERFPKQDSIWANPFKLNKEKSNRDEVLEKYKEYISKKIKDDPTTYDLEKLRGKNLGCWCVTSCDTTDTTDTIDTIVVCHGQILLKLLK